MSMHSEDFFGVARKLPADAIEKAAFQLDCEPEVLQAIAKKESRGSGFLVDGRPVILYEPHIFNRETKSKYLTEEPELATRSHTQNRYGPSGAYQYQKLERAMRLDEDAALQACSWGRFQIMGFNFKACGYSSVQEMVLAFCESEQAHLDAFINFLLDKGLRSAIRTKNWSEIARVYNGPAYAKNNYDTDLKKYYDELTSFVVRRGSSGEQVKTLQQLLNVQGAKPAITIDGIAGPETIEALKKFQLDNGLVADGIAGPATFTQLAAIKVKASPVINSKRVAGAVVSGGSGAAATSLGLMDYMKQGQKTVQQVQEVAATVTQASKQEAVLQAVDIVGDLSRRNMNLTIVIVIMGVIMMGLAGYIVWTKLYDNKKLKGIF